jgi:hypothetical protein
MSRLNQLQDSVLRSLVQMRQSEAQDPLRNLARYVQPALDMMELDRARKERDEQRAYTRARDAVSDERYAQQFEYQLDRDRITDERLRQDREQTRVLNDMAKQKFDLTKKQFDATQKQNEEITKAAKQETMRKKFAAFQGAVATAQGAINLGNSKPLKTLDLDIAKLNSEINDTEDTDVRASKIKQLDVLMDRRERLVETLKLQGHGDVSMDAIMMASRQTGLSDVAADRLANWAATHRNMNLEKVRSAFAQLGVSEGKTYTGASTFNVSGKPFVFRQVANPLHDIIDQSHDVLAALEQTAPNFQKEREGLIEGLRSIVERYPSKFQQQEKSMAGFNISTMSPMRRDVKAPTKDQLSGMQRTLQAAQRALQGAPRQLSPNEALQQKAALLPVGDGTQILLTANGPGANAMHLHPYITSSPDPEPQPEPEKRKVKSTRVDRPEGAPRIGVGTNLGNPGTSGGSAPDRSEPPPPHRENFFDPPVGGVGGIQTGNYGSMPLSSHSAVTPGVDLTPYLGLPNNF